MEKVRVSEDLLIVKDLIGKPKRYFNEKIEIRKQLEDLGYKVKEIEKKIESGGSFDLKKIREILYILKDKELSSSDVGKILKISRNRANEYLIKMERDGILESRFVGKKKLYTCKK
jgi:Fic family protein